MRRMGLTRRREVHVSRARNKAHERFVSTFVQRRRTLAGPLVCLFLALAAGGMGCDRKGTPSTSTSTPVAVEAGLSGAESARPPSALRETVEVPEVRVRPTDDTSVHVVWSTPEGTAVNDDAPFKVRWNRSDGLAEAPNDVKSTGSAVKDGFRLKVRPMAGAPNATLGGEIDIVVCDAQNHSVCVPVRRSVELGFIAVKDADDEVTVAIPLPAAK